MKFNRKKFFKSIWCKELKKEFSKREIVIDANDLRFSRKKPGFQKDCKRWQKLDI